MAEILILDERARTKGGGTVRVQLWQNQHTLAITSYAMAYINDNICSVDDGRVVGFDNAHAYLGHPTKHHRHWMGNVSHNKNFVSVSQTKERFQRILTWMKQHYKKGY
ncbi:MAG: DUF6516 family protein [Cytophagales bacterium]|nr:DUF6516 family protein [Cytophagales bacterium]